MGEIYIDTNTERTWRLWQSNLWEILNNIDITHGLPGVEDFNIGISHSDYCRELIDQTMEEQERSWRMKAMGLTDYSEFVERIRETCKAENKSVNMSLKEPELKPSQKLEMFIEAIEVGD